MLAARIHFIVVCRNKKKKKFYIFTSPLLVSRACTLVAHGSFFYIRIHLGSAVIITHLNYTLAVEMHTRAHIIINWTLRKLPDQKQGIYCNYILLSMRWPWNTLIALSRRRNSRVIGWIFFYIYFQFTAVRFLIWLPYYTHTHFLLDYDF